MRITYFHLIDNETFSNRSNIVNAILDVEYESDDSAWCIMLDRKVIATSTNYERVKRELELFRADNTFGQWRNV